MEHLMIGYVTLGTNDLERATAFYDALFAEMGGARMMEEEGYFVAWSSEAPGAALAASRPFDGNPATVGNGVMVALAVATEAAPGPRGDNFYAGYFRDLDGNKLNVFVAG